MMVLENASQYKDYLGDIFIVLQFCGSFRVVGNDIHLNIITIDNKEITKEQVYKKLKEIVLKKKKQELESQINAICKEKIIKEFRSSVLEDLHAYDLEVYDKNIEKGFIYIKPRFFFRERKNR